MITDAELSYLSFLSDAIVANPKKFRSFFKLARSFRNGVVSDEYIAILDTLEESYKRFRPRTLEDVRAMMNTLKGSPDQSESRAAHVLNWGVREHDWRPR